MTNDQELLQDAAKAAGLIPCAEGKTYRFDSEGGIFFDSGANSFTWDPLSDDGDALRLAALMGYNLYYVRPWVYVQDLEYSSQDIVIEKYDDDIGSKMIATRRAITRAAANIGKQLKEKNHD